MPQCCRHYFATTMKDLVFVSACPDDTVFSWQIEIFIESCRSNSILFPIHILVFIPFDRIKDGINKRFVMLADRYKKDNVSFFYYPDYENLVENGIAEIGYIPLLRPRVLKKHFELHPELTQKTIFYHDSDIVFTRPMEFGPFLNDEICYLSYTGSYMDSEYFDRAVVNVTPGLEDAYKEEDVIDHACRLVGINGKVCRENNKSCGGAQYLLKNIDANFWQEVENGCISIRKYLSYELGGINSRFFPSEAKGIQSWCADMWSLLWNLWKKNLKTITPPEMDFAWATDDITQWDKVSIYHDAGACSQTPYLFNKRDSLYLSGTTPFEVLPQNLSSEFCSYNYVKIIQKIKDKYYA